MPPKKKKIEKSVGRNAAYDIDIHPDWARALCIEGLSNKEIAQKFGIGESTFYEWINKYPEFSDALKEGKEPADCRVEMALYKRAMGYQYTETKVVTDGSGEIVKTERKTVDVVPDVGAQKLWLTNRKKAAWKERTVTEVEGGAPVVLAVLKGVKLEDL